MKLSDIINTNTASLEQATTAHDVIHKLFMAVIAENVGLIVKPEMTADEVLDRIYDLLRDLDTESRYLCEDILEEMMDNEDEGGII